jgi:hypothetical protein
MLLGEEGCRFPQEFGLHLQLAISRSSSQSRARSEIDSDGSSPTWVQSVPVHPVPEIAFVHLISRATSATGRDDSITIFTASSLNSGVNFLRRSRIDHPPFRAGPYWVRYPESGRLAKDAGVTSLVIAFRPPERHSIGV